MIFMANSYFILHIHHAKSFKMMHITYLYFSYISRYSLIQIQVTILLSGTDVTRILQSKSPITDPITDPIPVMGVADTSGWAKINKIQQIRRWTWGAFIYYVKVFWGFLEPPTPYIRTFSSHKIRKKCHFLNYPPPLCPYVKYKCSLVFLFSSLKIRQSSI